MSAITSTRRETDPKNGPTSDGRALIRGNGVLVLRWTLTVDKFYWTQKGGHDAGLGGIFRANIRVPRATSAVDYDGLDAETDTLADFMGLVADRFGQGSVVVDDEGELDFTDGLAPIGLDRDSCYRRVLEGDWETMSQAVLRIGFQTLAQRHTELAVHNSLGMFEDPSSRIWQEPLIFKDFIINLNFSTSPESQFGASRHDSG